MLPRKVLAVISRRSFNTKANQLRPVLQGSVVSCTAPRTSSVDQCRHQQLRQNSSKNSPAAGDDQLKSVPKYVKHGDWICTSCQAHNYGSRMLCFECHAGITSGKIFYKKGTWHCPTCNLFALLSHEGEHCRRCMTVFNKSYLYPLSTRDIQLPEDYKSMSNKKGDWGCVSCGHMNRAKNVTCVKCLSPRKITAGEEMLGDWQCKECQAVNFAHRSKCIACAVAKPRAESESQAPAEQKDQA